MSALDFPNPPLTIGQLYNGTNGVTYEWDGTVWKVPLGGAQLWSTSGATLTPTDATKTVAVPTASGNCVQFGPRTVKGRLFAAPGVDVVQLFLNRDNATGLADDVAKSSWAFRLGLDSDMAQFIRYPPSGGGVTLLTLDNAGTLTVPGHATSGNIVAGGMRTAKVHLVAHPSQDTGYVMFNRVIGAVDDATKPSWIIALDTVSDALFFNRAAAGATSGTTMLSTSAVGDLTITGGVATKATGTAWVNPSDIRLKKNVTQYARGLAEILQLEPISYTLKQNEINTCGFDAEQVRAVF